MSPKSKRSPWLTTFERNNAFRKAHMNLLAQPVKRRMMPPDTYFQTNVSRTALKASPSQRTLTMSVSKHKLRDEEEAKLPKLERDHMGRLPDGGYVKKAALKGVCTDRTKMMAAPRLAILVQNLREGRSRRGPKFVKLMNARINEIVKNNYTTMYKPSTSTIGSKGSGRKRSTASLKSEKDWQRHRLWLEERASAKRIPDPRPPPPRKTRHLEQLLIRLGTLAEPSERNIYVPPEDIPDVQPSALEYEITPRTEELSKHRPYDPALGPIRLNMAISKGALSYKPTERIIAIAQPKEKRLQANTEEKENPFAVSPNALTAKCSARTAQLALPTKRK